MERVSEPWRVALELAWEAMLAGTTPVGAVVVDGRGVIVTSGRGRRYERALAERQLSYSHLAHAEVNALAQLDPLARYHDHVLLTTLEPCLLCVGAALMATVGSVEYAGEDPCGGAAHLRFDHRHRNRPMPTIRGPVGGVVGAVGALLHYAFYVERDAEGAVPAAYRSLMPEFVETMDASGKTAAVLELKAAGRDLVSVLQALA